MIVLVAVFLIQNVFVHWFHSSLIEDYFALSLPNLSHGLVYTILTYGLLHGMDSVLPLHLLGNLLALYFTGRFVQDIAGPQKFLELFVFGVIGGGLFWLMVRLVSDPATILLGASAGVLAVVTVFCLILRDQPIQLLFLPVSFSAIHLLYFLAGLTLFLFLFDELPGTRGQATAHSAHLGGMFAGYLYHRFLFNQPALSSLFGRRRTAAMAPAWESKKPAVRAAGAGRFSVNITSRDKLQKEVDRILDKINEQGFGSLSAEEKETLDRARERLK